MRRYEYVCMSALRVFLSPYFRAATRDDTCMLMRREAAVVRAYVRSASEAGGVGACRARSVLRMIAQRRGAQQ